MYVYSTNLIGIEKSVFRSLIYVSSGHLYDGYHANFQIFAYTDANITNSKVHGLPMFVLFEERSSLYVPQNDGKDYQKCGFVSFPCKTLAFINSDIKDFAKRTIQLTDSETFKNPTPWDNTVLALSASSSATITSTTIDQFPVSVDVFLTNLVFGWGLAATSKQNDADNAPDLVIPELS